MIDFATRLLIYKQMLNSFTYHTGFCDMVWFAERELKLGFIFGIEHLPELYKFRPNNDEEYICYWFRIGNNPGNPRREILETIIAEMEKGGQQ